MKDEQPTPKDDDDEDILDKYDDVIVNADATGMVAGERMITTAEIAQAQTESDGDVPKR